MTQMRKHFSFAFVLFFLLQLNFFPLRWRHQRSAYKIRPDGAPSFTGNHFKTHNCGRYHPYS